MQGYLSFSTTSVSIDAKAPEVIQRRGSITPALPREKPDSDQELQLGDPYVIGLSDEGCEGWGRL